ncbi:hypothetical protein ACQ7B2_02460, partial [Escherichia coli]
LSQKNLTASEPINPADPVTSTVFIVLYSLPYRISAVHVFRASRERFLKHFRSFRNRSEAGK